MDFLGKYKVFKVGMLQKDFQMSYEDPKKYIETIPTYINADNAEEVAHEKAQRKMQMDAIISIEEDQKLYCLMPLPEDVSQEEIDAAIAEGDIELKDGMMMIESHEWKVVDGVLKYDTGVHGEIAGEAVDPFKNAFDEEGYLNLNETKYVKQ